MNRITAAQLPVFETQRRMLDRLRQRYPFIAVEEAGRSVLGRCIYSVRIGGGDEATLFAAAFHANEWLTILLMLRFIERLCEALDSGSQLGGMDCRRALLGRGLTVVPCVNPDGVEISLLGFSSAHDLAPEVARIAGDSADNWTANARGVDLNRNYDAGWHISRQLETAAGITGAAPRRYGGERPESEPETQAMVRLCEQRRFRCALAFHSQGEEIYWHYGEHTPQRSQLIARVLAMSSGYRIAEPENIAAHAGFKDWFIDRYRRPAFTIEVGSGRNPLPLASLDDIYERIEEMLMLAIVI